MNTPEDKDIPLNSQPMLIYNPAAGKGSAGKILPQVQALLNEHGFAYDLLLTSRPGDAQIFACRAAEEGCPLVVVAGGDGTINEAVNGLMTADLAGKVRPTMAVLSVGRGNDFAYGMSIPHELSEAVDVLVSGHHRRIDVGHFHGGDFPEGRYFANGVGLGFDTVVGFEAAKITWLHGMASYLVAMVRTIFLYSKAPVYEITMDGETLQQAFLMVSVMNGSRMGGSFHMAPDSDPGDSIFDLCLAGQVSQSRILPLAVKFISGTQKEHPAVRMAQARKITIRAIEGTIPAHADGETICTAGLMLTIEIIPDSLDVVFKQNGRSYEK